MGQGWAGRGMGRRHSTALAAGKLPPTLPAVAAGQRALLLVHGTFSHTASAFGVLAVSDFFEAVRPMYGDRVYGFDHFTISKGPEENVSEMLASSPCGGGGAAGTFDVVSHSRGGLVVRTLRATARRSCIWAGPSSSPHPTRVRLSRPRAGGRRRSGGLPTCLNWSPITRSRPPRSGSPSSFVAGAEPAPR